jgi:glyoxylase-like metal-dependent hydrolase (beta-lactamase superfamily II)/rhodanese-related sulfurtransferase
VEVCEVSDWEITVDELRRLLERGEGIALWDVRSAEDRREWFIPGSVHWDVDALLRSGDVSALENWYAPAGLPVVVVCNRGRTSGSVVEWLRKREISAFSLRGGMQAWSLAWNLAEVPWDDGAVRVLQVRRTGKGCLSYFVASGGEAAVIDPSVEPDVYLDLAERRGWRITRVLDTHVHADHISRSRALARATGADLHLPEQKRVKFAFSSLKDRETVKVGQVTLEILATPGHTFESACYLLEGKALFTGDTLFLDGVGRPDLAAEGEEETRARAALLYHSLRRIAGLPRGTLVLPGHTASPVPFDGEPLVASLGEVLERVELLELAEEDFVQRIMSRMPSPPANHWEIVRLNEEGRSVDDPAVLEAGANRCAVT